MAEVMLHFGLAGSLQPLQTLLTLQLLFKYGEGRGYVTFGSGREHAAPANVRNIAVSPDSDIYIYIHIYIYIYIHNI